MVLEIPSGTSTLFCSFCGMMIRDLESQKCLDCGAAFCPRCASQLQLTGTGLKCPCGSSEIEKDSSPQSLKTETLERIFTLKRSLKQVGYQPVIVLKRTGHLEERLRSFRKQFLIPGNQIDKIFLDTKKIENFTLSEFQEFASKLNRLYRSLMDSSFTDYRNLSLQLTLFQKQIKSFDQTVQDKLQPIHDLIEQIEDQCDQFDEMSRHLGRCFDIFFFVPGELAIGFFSNTELRNSRIRKTTIDLVITTDRIVLLRKKRHNIIGQKFIVYDEFPPEDLIDVQKTSTRSGFLKRDKLLITTIKHDYELRADYQTLMQIFDALQLSYYGRPNEIIYVHEPFRDWSSEIYQEKILSAINFQKNVIGNTRRTIESHPDQEKEPDFVTGVLDDRLRDLRLRKLANEKALQELKEGRRKVSSRDYFDLIKQFELELAKINEAITELLVRTGKTNLLN